MQADHSREIREMQQRHGREIADKDTRHTPRRGRGAAPQATYRCTF